MARAGTLIGISYRLVVYQQTEADPPALSGTDRLLGSKGSSPGCFEELIRAAVPIPDPVSKAGENTIHFHAWNRNIN